jgi:hypothetical protein
MPWQYDGGIMGIYGIILLYPPSYWNNDNDIYGVYMGIWDNI